MTVRYVPQALKVPRLMQQLYWSLAFILIELFIGTLAYRTLEGYPVLDAFYMTLITMASVGFMEVHPLSDTGRLFTAVLIVANVGVFAYAVGNVSRFFLDTDQRKALRDYRMLRAIENIKDHVVVCGYGRIGHQVVEELLAEQVPFVVIEQNPAMLDDLRAKVGLYYIEGDCTQDEVLHRAGIVHARSLITTLPKDADNVFVVLTARELNPKMPIISRSSSPTSYNKLQRSGCNYIIMPERIGGVHMAALVTKPDIIEFVTLLTSPAGTGIIYSEFSYDQLKPEYRNQPISAINARYSTGANIIGMKTRLGEYIINPDVNTAIEPGSYLIVISTERQLAQFREKAVIA